MSTIVTLIPGDQHGAEQTAAVKTLLAAVGLSIDWDIVPFGEHEVPAAVHESLGRSHLGLMGFQSAWAKRNAPPPVVQLRDAFGMFANLRPIRTLKGLKARHEGVDILLVREITEDVYRHLEHESIPGVYESLKVTTKAACERIAKYAFETARAEGRKKVTIVHKSNIMKKSDGMFLKTARDVAAGYPEIAHEDVIVDALCMKLVLSPQKFDVLVAGNLYGDIVADLCAGLVGGAANCPSISVGPTLRLVAAPHGTGGDNLLEVLVPAVELARLIDSAAADRLRSAIETALIAGASPTSAAFVGAVQKAL